MALDVRNHVDQAEFKAMASKTGVGASVAATTTTAGVVKQAAIQADSVAADVPGVVADFNALLAKLRTAGILAE